MKTAGRLTALLLSLLGIYLLGYWVLIKKDWVTKLHIGAANPLLPNPVEELIHKAFHPLKELETIWTVDIPTRKYLTGHWRTEAGHYFVTLEPNYECQFQLGPYAYRGKATYKRSEAGFIVEFPHGDQLHLFVLSMNKYPRRWGIANFAHIPGPANNTDKASFCVESSYIDPFQRQLDLWAPLSKQTPNVTAP